MASQNSEENLRIEKLANGITVLTEQMPHVRSASVGIWIASGSRNETPRQNGLSHFVEHMLFKGTEQRSAEDIARQVDSIGGHLDAFTTKEMVCYNVKALDEHLPLAFDVLADLVLHPVFRDEDIERERGVILEELKMEVDNPEYLVHELFTSSFWKGHALGRPIIGSRKTILSFDRQSTLDFYRSVYRPSNIVISAAGHITHEQIVGLVERYFRELPASEGAAAEPAPAAHPALTFKNKRSLEQVHLTMGVPSNSLCDEMRYPSYVLNVLLGGGMSSRLFQNIREKRGLAYSVFTEQLLYRDSGCFSVSAGTSIEHVPELLRLVLAEFRDLKERPVPAEELRRAKDNLKGSVMLSLESTNSRMSHLGRQYIYYQRVPSMDEILEDVERVTAADIQGLANQFFHTDRIALTVLGRLNGFELSREHLAC